VGTVIEVALSTLLRRWRSVLLLALLFVGPAALLTAATGLRFNSVAMDIFPGISEGVIDDIPVLTTAQFERLAGALGAVLLATLLAGALGSIGAVGISAAILGRGSSWRADLRAALRVALRRTPSVLAFMLVTSVALVGLIVVALAAMSLAISILSSGSLTRGGPGVFVALVALVALVVAVAYLTMRWALAYPVMAMEDAGWRAAMARSWHLSADNIWRTLLVVVFGALLTLLGAASLSQLLAIVLVDGVAAEAGLDPTVIESVVVAFVTVLLAPLSPALLAVLYVDLRLRRDAVGAGGHVEPQAGPEQQS
jgi:hypothetical protein